jgi:signal peptidase I
MSSVRTGPSRWLLHALVMLLSAAVIGSMAVVFGALAAGYRPVVILTGSMGDTAPPGALVIAAPKAPDQVVVGDVLVMRRPGSPTITHRVIELESNADRRFAITKGDANETVDATPHPLDAEQLVGRWYLPGWGRRLQSVAQPGIALGLVGLAVAAVTFQMLRRIWSRRNDEPADADATDRVADAPLSSAERRRRRMAAAATPVILALTAGISWALFQSEDSVVANEFGTQECFDPQLGSVQTGSTIHAVDGAVTVAIDAVDPTGAFVLTSLRSNAVDPVDATVQVRLVNGGTEIELLRMTDAPVPPPVTVSWSVVEYTCGVSVQRGVTNGNGSTALDISIDAAPAAQRFAIMSTVDVASATSFGGDDLVVAEVTSDTNLRLRSASPLSAGRSFAWQIVTFDDPGDISVQHLTAQLDAGDLATSVVLSDPVDASTTFLIAGATSPGDGADIGARAVRAHLSSSTSVEVSRQVTGEALDVALQVVTLRDGSSVRHGTVDFDAGQPARTATFPAVDAARSTAMSTVALAGPSAGGSTDMVADDVIGEASAEFVLVDERTVVLTRDATTAAASFGWQVIEWAGPSWWDPAYTFRQRIDVRTDAAAAPGAYTVPITVDHAALVANGLSLVDGTDVRVLRWNGTSWAELDRVLDDGSAWDTTTTTLLFRTTDPVAADSMDSYWLYFGADNPTAPPVDPKQVFALVENFDAGTLGDFEDRTAGGAWYEADPWTHRRALTIPSTSIGADLANFSVLVQLVDPTLAASAQPDASDLRFTAADEVTILDHEIEWWDPTTGALTAWVRVPSVSSDVDTRLYLLAGASDAPDGQDVRGSWSSGWDAVWHLARDPSGSAPQAADSGPRRAGGLTVGSMAGAELVTGLAGAALDLDGVDDGIEVPAIPIGASGAFTVSAWVRPDTLSSDATVFAAAADGSAVVTLWLQSTSATTATLRADVVVDGATVSTSAGTVVAGGWHHVAVVFDGTELRALVDGVAGPPSSAFGRSSQPNQVMTIGAGPAGHLDGLIDEVRIAQVAHGSAWIDAHVANLTDPGFVIEGSNESGTWLGHGPWSRRKPLVIDGTLVSGTPTDQVVFVSFDDPDIAAMAAADGRDLVFTGADGMTRLDHVLESYDAATGGVRAWVAVPLLDGSSDTAMFVYYSGAAARDQQDAVAVFGPDADLALLPD